MSATTVREFKYTYKVKCLTEGVDYEIKANMNNVPTCCPTQGFNHVIDSNNIQIINKDYEEYAGLPKIVIQETTEDILQGYFRVKQYCFHCPSNSQTPFEFSWKYPVSVSAVKLITKIENDGDLFESCACIPTPIGICTSNIDIGNTTIKVNSTVLQYLAIGFKVKVSDNVNSEYLGEAMTLYTDRIIVETPSTHTYAAGSYIYIEVPNIESFKLHQEVPLLELGSSKIGGTIVKPGMIIKAFYTNLSLDVNKYCTFILEYSY
jgi:hypothetical protein